MKPPSDVMVQFLGSGDAFGSGGRLQACIRVSSPGYDFLMDCGASSLAAMKRFAVDPSSIRAVYVSHLHGDHFGGLPFLILDGQFSGRTEALQIIGPPGLEDRTTQAMEVLFPGSSKVEQRFDVQFTELDDRHGEEKDGVTVTAYSVTHASGAPAYAFRFLCANKIIAYSGDTEWTDALILAARGADLLICEAYFFEKKVRYHLDYRTLELRRGDLACKRIILTHMSQDMLNRQSEIKFECAEEGREVFV